MEAARSWSVEDVVSMFQSIRLDKYCDIIREENINGFVLVDLFQNSGLEDLGMSKIHQARLRGYFYTGNEGSATEPGAPAANKTEMPAKTEANVKNLIDAKAQVEVESETKIEATGGAKVETIVDAGSAAKLQKDSEVKVKETEILQVSVNSTATVARNVEVKPNIEGAVEKQKEIERMITFSQAAAPIPSEPPPIFAAVDSENPEEICSLIAKHADPNSVSPAGDFPLLNAVMCKNHSIVALLLISKADMHMCTTTGLRALDFVERKDQLMRELLTQPLSSMQLDSVYNHFHQSDEWREARELLQYARNYARGTQEREFQRWLHRTQKAKLQDGVV